MRKRLVKILPDDIGSVRRQFERAATDRFADGATANALSTDLHGFGRAIVLGNAYSLQIRPELPARNSGDLGTDTTQILGLTAGLYRVAHLGAFSTNFTDPGHANHHIKSI